MSTFSCRWQVSLLNIPPSIHLLYLLRSYAQACLKFEMEILS